MDWHGTRRDAIRHGGSLAGLVAAFHLTDAVAADFSLSAKLGQSSPVHAVARMADGSARHARKDIEVVLGACVGEVPVVSGLPGARSGDTIELSWQDSRGSTMTERATLP
jgi:hypothetical protein